MDQDLRDKIKAASASPAAPAADLAHLLKLIDQHYEQMEATITQSVAKSLAQPLDTLSKSANSDSGQPPLDLIFNSIADAVLVVSKDGVVKFCNDASTVHFGRNASDLSGATLEQLFPDAAGVSCEKFLAPFIVANGEGRTSVGEVNARRHNGEVFVADLNVSRIQWTDGEAFVISMRGITGRGHPGTMHRDNEIRYRALIENAPEAIVVFDVDDDKFIDANDNACMLFNLSKARLLSIGPSAISPKMQPDGTPSFGVRRGYVDRALNGDRVIFEWLHKDSVGREIPCEVRFSRLPDSRRRLIRVSITNVAERKRSESLAFAQNKVLEMIASGAPHDRILRAICRCIETIGDDLRAAILQVDASGDTISIAEAPSLSESFRQTLKLVRIDKASIGSGAAVHNRMDRIVSDIAADSGWAPYFEIAEASGIQAVWTFLLYGDADRIVGTLDVFCKTTRGPTTDELDKFGRMTRLAGIAIKRQIDESKLRDSEARYRGLFENVVDGVYIATRDGDLIAANPALVEMLGYDNVQQLKAIGKTTQLYVNPIDRERVFARLETDGYIRNFEFRLRRKDGREIVVLENSRAIRSEGGKVTANEGTITDITDRKRAETRIFEEKERAQITLQSIGDGVVTTNAEGQIDYINPVAQDLTGWDIRSAIGKPVTDIMTIVNENTRAPVENPVMRCLREGRVITLGEHSTLITANGTEVPIQDSAAPIRDRVGNIVGSVMVFHDVSKETRLFRQISYQASHDALTGLINRHEFENRLASALDNAKDDPATTHALLYLDLDQFKVINDTFGHFAGDALLRQLSELLQANIRSTDILARLGGDEFGILLERCGEERAEHIAETIRSAIEAFRFTWQESCTSTRCSIGIVVVSSDCDSVGGLMSSADVACYSAKDQGRNQIHLYRDSDASLRHEEMKWVSRINSAVEESRFELFFQPIISIGEHLGTQQTNGCKHYEVLLRMRDESGNLIGPDQFIPAAERYNLMSTLDRWVIHESLTNLADRNADGEARFTVAINLSGTSLSEDRFLDYVVNELKRQNLPKGAICFEITETAAISNLSRVAHFMQTLKAMGCKFSLDDFGSGLSSFTYLKNLPVDYIKIDGQFIRNVVDDSVDQSMVRAMREVGNALGIATIAERVETRQVLDKLGLLGVEFAQGYYIARPASVQSFRPRDKAANMGLSA